GQYEVRLFARDSFARLATSNRFVVATPTPTPTNTTTATATATGTPTDTATTVDTDRTTATAASAAPATIAWLDTTAADFGLGVVSAGLVVADEAGGEVRRAAALEDYFNGPVGAVPWSWGTWSGAAYDPAPAAGALVVQSPSGSAWLRSNATFAQQTLEGRIAFGAGAWQHVG